MGKRTLIEGILYFTGGMVCLHFANVNDTVWLGYVAGLATMLGVTFISLYATARRPKDAR